MSDEPKIRRPSVRPFDDWLDDFMLGVGIRTLDFAQPETRDKLRKYVARQTRHLIDSLRFDIERGSARGIKQTIDFMFDPGHDRTVKRNRKVLAERRKVREAERTINQPKVLTEKVQ